MYIFNLFEQYSTSDLDGEIIIQTRDCTNADACYEILAGFMGHLVVI